jgi:hypothetical protein
MHKPFTYSRNEFNARFLFFPDRYHLVAHQVIIIAHASAMPRPRLQSCQKVQPSKLTIAQTSQNPKDIAAKDS